MSPGKPAANRRPARKTAAVSKRKSASKATRTAASTSARPSRTAPKIPRPTAKAKAKPAATRRKPLAKLTPQPKTKTSNPPKPRPAPGPVAVAPIEPPPPAAPPPPPKKPSFYEAIAIYENAVRGLQRHDYVSAAASFRQVLQRYPEERELIDRARLYLRVCERETAQRPAGPQTTAERVHAATMSLSAGDSDAALNHAQRALDQEPGSHHAHYMMAVIRSTRSENAEAVEHLRRAIELNPESRSVARNDSDLESLRQYPTVRSLLDEDETADARARARGRR